MLEDIYATRGRYVIIRSARILPITLAGVCALIWFVGIQPTYADTRIALVVGNSDYRYIPRLTNPTNDAKLVAETLTGLGFRLVGGGAQLDVTKAQFDQAVQDFGNAALNADVALFYYAGHGVQVSGANYLVPISANPTKQADVDFQMLDVNLVLRQMEGARTHLNIVILDACRNNPFGGRGLRAASGGLAQMQAPEGTLIAFATQPGNVAQDGADDNSPYSKALAKSMRKPGLDIFRTFNDVGLAVSWATNGEQQPWISISPITGEFYFAELPETPKPAAPDKELEAERAKLAAQTQQPNNQQVALSTPSDAGQAGTAPLAGSALTQQIEMELMRVGCYVGQIDGNWSSPQVKLSVVKFVKAASLTEMPDQPSTDLLNAIRSQSLRVCPLECAKTETESNGKCIAKTCPSGQKLDSEGDCTTVKERNASRPPAAAAPAAAPAAKTESGDIGISCGRFGCRDHRAHPAPSGLPCAKAWQDRMGAYHCT